MPDNKKPDTDPDIGIGILDDSFSCFEGYLNSEILMACATALKNSIEKRVELSKRNKEEISYRPEKAKEALDIFMDVLTTKAHEIVANSTRDPKPTFEEVFIGCLGISSCRAVVEIVGRWRPEELLMPMLNGATRHVGMDKDAVHIEKATKDVTKDILERAKLNKAGNA